MTEFNDKIEHWFADSIGKCFAMSVKDGYDSYMFSKEFLSSDWGSGLLSEKRIREYESVPYMYAKAKKNLELKQGITYEEYLMWMYGYLVKYWVTTKDVTPQEVWEVLPIDKFDKLFLFYHTQGWNYIIKDAYKRRSRQGSNIEQLM